MDGIKNVFAFKLPKICLKDSTFYVSKVPKICFLVIRFPQTPCLRPICYVFVILVLAFYATGQCSFEPSLFATD